MLRERPVELRIRRILRLEPLELDARLLPAVLFHVVLRARSDDVSRGAEVFTDVDQTLGRSVTADREP